MCLLFLLFWLYDIFSLVLHFFKNYFWIFVLFWRCSFSSFSSFSLKFLFHLFVHIVLTFSSAIGFKSLYFNFQNLFHCFAFEFYSLMHVLFAGRFCLTLRLLFCFGFPASLVWFNCFWFFVYFYAMFLLLVVLSNTFTYHFLRILLLYVFNDTFKLFFAILG